MKWQHTNRSRQDYRSAPAVVQKAFDTYKIDDPTATRGFKQEGGDA